MSQKTWTATIDDAEDGSGDAILTFPDELIANTGWKEGTKLDLKVENGVLYITEVKE